jgi:hypothetical protein
MIDLQSRHKPAYANAVGWMAVSDDYNLSELNTRSNWIKKAGHLMTFADERSTEHVDVVLDSPNLWVKEVGDHTGDWMRGMSDKVGYVGE